MARRPFARPAPRPILRPRRAFGDSLGGQMMMLSAVLLLIGFVALAGMVARVNQLGAQTGTESRRAILDEVGPLADAIDSGITKLANRTVTVNTQGGTPAGTLLVASTAVFTPHDLGLNVTGTGISTTVAEVISSTTIRILVADSSRTASESVVLRVPGFALTASTTPTATVAVTGLMSQLERLAVGKGLFLDWSLAGCSGGQDRVVASLSDGTVWVQVRSNAWFPC